MEFLKIKTAAEHHMAENTAMPKIVLEDQKDSELLVIEINCFLWYFCAREEGSLTKTLRRVVKFTIEGTTESMLYWLRFLFYLSEFIFKS